MRIRAPRAPRLGLSGRGVIKEGKVWLYVELFIALLERPLPPANDTPNRTAVGPILTELSQLKRKQDGRQDGRRNFEAWFSPPILVAERREKNLRGRLNEGHAAAHSKRVVKVVTRFVVSLS